MENIRASIEVGTRPNYRLWMSINDRMFPQVFPGARSLADGGWASDGIRI